MRCRIDGWGQGLRLSAWRALALLGLALGLLACKAEVPATAGSKAAPGSAKERVVTRRVPPASERPRVPRHATFPDAAQALEEILRADKPQVIGFGEVHQKTTSLRTRSAIKRFTEQLLTKLAPQASDLLVETWVTKGQCGKTEKRVVKQVEKTTQRPQSTENEIITLLRRGKALGLEPHVLELGCQDYAKIAGGKGKLDAEALLTTVTRHLEAKIAAIRRRRLAKSAKAAQGAKPARELLVVYGGALHNDVHPPKDLGMFSYVPFVRKRKERFVEVDLYVPELVQGDRELAKESWFPLLGKATPQQVLLIERGGGSYILVLRRGVDSGKGPATSSSGKAASTPKKVR